ncbi:hypothetical protein [Paenibacillus endoradicis]|uniref:hypothetical protein n=1 Tax=Paenibacillus endoradicis TaxID=2972487 RepID=UPI0021591A84|nr:hypothetical protein [Paenibacillus endoradicis]MCR8656049.1 hypothetical protein [Paenibacillus endoradicis]MCR8658375.1 hypothetical protein [Paenibacillus endoradicis]
MNRNYEVEYCNLELRFERRQIQTLIRELIQEGYSLYWSETEGKFLVSIRTGRKLVKLHFEKVNQRYRIVGDYIIKDERLSELIEKLINDTRGHAVVKRIKDRQIVIENIMFGEIIRLVEVSGMEHRIIYQKKPYVTFEDMIQAFQNKRAEQRISVLRMELDYELSCLNDAIIEQDEQKSQEIIDKLELLRLEMLQLEM